MIDPAWQREFSKTIAPYSLKARKLVPNFLTTLSEAFPSFLSSFVNTKGYIHCHLYSNAILWRNSNKSLTSLTYLWLIPLSISSCLPLRMVDCVWNVMAHAQKPDSFFRRNGRVHLNRQGRQFSRLLVAEVCASAVVMLNTPCSEVVWRVLATHSIRQFPLHFPPVRHRVPSLFNWTLQHKSGWKEFYGILLRIILPINVELCKF